MDTRIKGTDYTIPPEIATYLDSRLASIEKLLGEDGGNTRCEVELGRDAGRPKHGANIWFVEINIRVPGGMHVRATNRSESINGAIDDAKEEVERQLRREKSVHRRFLRKTGAYIKDRLRFGRE